MVKYDFVLYAGRNADFIERLRELGLVDVTTTGWEPSDADRQLLSDIEGYAKAVDYLAALRADGERFDAKAPAFATGCEAYEHYCQAAQTSATLVQEIARLEKAADELAPWGDFSADDVAQLAQRGIVLRYFTTPASNWDKRIEEWRATYTLEPIARTGGTVYFVIVAAPGQEVAIDAQEVKAPQMDARTAERRIGEHRDELKRLDEEFSRAAASLDAIRAEQVRLRERLQEVRITATAATAAEGTLSIMEGWAEKATSDKVDALLAEYPDVIYLKSDPTPEDDTPVKLNNGWFARVFEMVGDMYARPKYGTVDLTPFFAPFYMLFFGICLNDAGYGLILMLMGMWMLHRFKDGMMRRASWFATLCGLSTVLFGLFCGSFFGLNLKEYFPEIPFFDFQGQFFSIALAIGMVQILFGMAISIWATARSFGFRYALGTLGWFIILLAGSLAVGLPMLGEQLAIPGFGASSPVFYAALGLGFVLMLLFNTPGRNPLLNIPGGLWNLYNNITGLLSDVLSYIRLFAIGLSGGVLALVFNSLADGFVPDGSGIVVRILVMLPILLIGHGINLFMSTISSFVHPMRLTFVEFYKNAGFEMASRSFEPLRKMDQTDK